MMPLARIDAASSCSRSGSKTRLGWTGLASISSMRIVWGLTAAAGAEAAAAGSATGALRVGRRAVNPLPSALRGPSGGLFIGENLLGQLNVGLGSFRANVVTQDWLAVAGRL